MSLAKREEVLAAARRLLARGGPGALTMRALGEAAGVRAPSLYKHLASREDLERALAGSGWEELAGLCRAWAAERGADLARLERGYLRFAAENAGLYRLMAAHLAPTHLVSMAAALQPPASTQEEARRALAALHGEALLELAAGQPGGPGPPAILRPR